MPDGTGNYTRLWLNQLKKLVCTVNRGFGAAP